jgi:hypothetical protein
MRIALGTLRRGCLLHIRVLMAAVGLIAGAAGSKPGTFAEEGAWKLVP